MLLPTLIVRPLTVLTPALVLAIVLTITFGFISLPSDANPTADYTSNSLTEQADLSAHFIARLINSGWSRQAATAVIELNMDYFNLLIDEPEQLEAHFQRLERLGRYENLAIMPRLARHPELAALYAGARIPIELDRAFVNEDCMGVYAGMFQLIVDPNEQNELVDAFQRHGFNICALGAMGITVPAAIFMFDHTRQGADEYSRWLNKTVSRSLRSSEPEESVTSIVAFALNRGEYLRNRLGQDNDFRRQFRARLWPSFVRVTDCSRKPEGECDTPLELLAEEPRVWDLLMQDRGEELLAQGGLLAVELFTDPPSGAPFPRELRPVASEALMQGNNDTLGALIRFQGEPLFRRLMQRDDLDTDLRQRVLGDISRVCPETAPQCPDLERRLRQINGFPLATLREDLAPAPTGLKTWIPLYDTYYTFRQIAQGRDVSALDIAFATMDVVVLPFDIVSAGKTRMATQSIRRGVKSNIRRSARNSNAAKVTKSLTKQTLRKASRDKRTTRSFFDQAAKTGRLMTAVSQVHLKTMVNLAKSTNNNISRSMTFDLTKPVQWMFQRTGIGRSSMKKITGLEARVFMRRDARVFINPTKGRVGLMINMFQDMIEENVLEEIEEISKKVWQKHASSWWLENAS